jgi:membrane-associated phospholipid phosphatase
MPNDCRNCRGFLLPAILLLMAAAALWIDVPVATKLLEWKEQYKKVGDYLGYLNVFEPFGHGLGVALVLIALHQLDPARRWAIPRVLACALAGGGLANIVKLAIARLRPNDLAEGFHGSVWDTFGSWLPMFTTHSGSQSFPSAHMATAAGLSAGLIWLYPNGRVLFTVLAALVGCQRIAAGAHYPSDVLVGAAAGCVAATLLLYVGRLPAWFDRLESRWRPVGGDSCRR